MIVGNYRIFFWRAITKTGVSGWVVATPPPSGGLGDIKSKHKTKREAIIAAQRFTKIDEEGGKHDHTDVQQASADV